MTTPDSPDKMPVEPFAEHMYRRGYLRGIYDLLEQLPHKFSTRERDILEQWVAELTRTWQVNNLSVGQRPPKLPTLSEE